jgi:hypothetical protein
MSPEDIAAIQLIANNAAEAKANAVLRSTVLLNVQLMRDLIAKGVLSREEYVAGIERLQQEGAKARKDAPELSQALLMMTMMIGQVFGEPSASEPS